MTSRYGFQTSSVIVRTHNSVLSTRRKSLYWFQPSPVVLCMQNSGFRTRITSLCGFQTPPVVSCMQNSDFWTRITSLYGSQTSPDASFMQNSVPSTYITSLYLYLPSSVVFEYKTGTFRPEIQVSMGPSSYLRILHAKQRDLHQNDNSIWVPAIVCGFVHPQQRL